MVFRLLQSNKDFIFETCKTTQTIADLNSARHQTNICHKIIIIVTFETIFELCDMTSNGGLVMVHSVIENSAVELGFDLSFHSILLEL